MSVRYDEIQYLDHAEGIRFEAKTSEMVEGIGEFSGAVKFGIILKVDGYYSFYLWDSQNDIPSFTNKSFDWMLDFIEEIFGVRPIKGEKSYFKK